LASKSQVIFLADYLAEPLCALSAHPLVFSRLRPIISASNLFFIPQRRKEILNIKIDNYKLQNGLEAPADFHSFFVSPDTFILPLIFPT